jgi:prepilin-type N-terminal cleavage/methylation domain-containing protein
MVRRRAAFTLIELLITIVVIAILAGAMMTALFGAVEAARQMRTRQLITKTNDHMLARYDAYQTQRLPIYSVPGVARNIYATKRLWALRELMRMEMPDRYSDLQFTSAVLPSTYKSDLRRIYQARVKAATKSEDEIDYDKVAESNESAECLYLIMTAGGSERNILGVAHSETDVADTDFDGMLEFVDAWGQPLGWCRWPAGIVSDLQPMYLKKEGTDDKWTRDPIRNHDVFDPQLVDPNPPVLNPSTPPNQPAERGYNIVPLIVSAGANGSFGMRGLEDSTTLDLTGVMTRGSLEASESIDPPSSAGGVERESDPYMQYTPRGGGGGDSLFLGTVVNSTAYDNIMNHNITSGVMTWVKGEQ